MSIKKIKELAGQFVVGVLLLIFLALVKGDRLFGWSPSLAFLAGLGFVAAVFLAAFWWSGRKWRDPVEEEDPILGKVLIFGETWSGSFRDPFGEPEDDDGISVSGEGVEGPSVIQKATFVEVKDGWSRWVAILEKALDGHQDPAISARSRHVYCYHVKLAAEEMSWKLEFSILRDDEDLDLEAEFREGKIKVRLLERNPTE